LTVDVLAILVWGVFNDGTSGVGPTLTPLPDFATASELGPTSVPDSVAFVVAKVERGVEENGRGCVPPRAMEWSGGREELSVKSKWDGDDEFLRFLILSGKIGSAASGDAIVDDAVRRDVEGGWLSGEAEVDEELVDEETVDGEREDAVVVDEGRIKFSLGTSVCPVDVRGKSIH